MQVFIPLIVSVYDSFRLQGSPSRKQGDIADQDVHENTNNTGHHWYLYSRFRYVLPTFLVSLGSHLAAGLWFGASSTYICPLVLGQTRTVPLMQFIAAALDCYLVITAYELCVQRSYRGKKPGAKIPLVWASILLVRTPSNGECASSC